MEHNVVRETNSSSVFSTINNSNNVEKKASTSKCLNCKKAQLECDLSFPCSTCVSLGKKDNCTKEDVQNALTKGAKRGYKSHVPSACVNCKTAHLACDVSRPCKRCVSSNKTDTCHDMQHKKRGRPKLKDRKHHTSNDNQYEILYGTIQTPNITSRNIVPHQQVPPFKSKLSQPTKRHPPPTISFVHEPIESFKQTDQSKPTLEPSHPNPDDSFLRLESVLPSVQLSLEPSLPKEATNPPSFIDDQLIQQLISTPSHPPLLTQTDSVTHPTLLDNLDPSHLIDPPIVTIILSMDVCCAKISDEIIQHWGYYPQELAHRSLYDFISTEDSDRLTRLHNLLIKDSQPTQAEKTTSSLFLNTDPKRLAIKANGSQTFSDTLRIKKRSGEYELYQIKVYIGGGLGANLFEPETGSKHYIVAEFKKYEVETAVDRLLDSPDDFLNYPPLFSPPNHDFPSYEKVENRLLLSKFAQKSAPLVSPKINRAPVVHPTLHRFSPSSHRSGSVVTHPTHQYFLQTSSSTLNAAASAVQNKSRQTIGEPTVVGTRKVEMSIRSLLC